MATVISVLLMLSFLQGAGLPFNLVFMVIICRAFVAYEKSNYYLAFGFGLLLSLFLGLPFGALSLFYLMSVLLISSVRKSQFASNWMAVLPLAVIFLAVNQAAGGWLAGSGPASLLKWPVLFLETALILPVYFVVRFWEERFVPRKEIRLKVGK